MTMTTAVGISDPTAKPQHCGSCPLRDYRRIPSIGGASPILLLGEYPPVSSPTGGKPFQDREGSIINMAIRHIQKAYYGYEDGVNRWNKLKTARGYTVQCVGADKPPKMAVQKCRKWLLSTLDVVEPRVIVTFGAGAL